MASRGFSLRLPLLSILAAVLVLPVLVFFPLRAGHGGKKASSSSPASSGAAAGASGLTLRQAARLAGTCARAWAADAKPLSVESTDSSDRSATSRSGLNGRRRVWNVYFDSRKKGRDYLVTVSQGKARGEGETDCGDLKSFALGDVSLDSPAAVKEASSRKGLRPGSKWAKGYHFNLGYVSYDEHPGRQHLVFEVVGLSPAGKFAHVDIDAETGKVLSAQQETYDKNGNPVWKNF